MFKLRVRLLNTQQLVLNGIGIEIPHGIEETEWFTQFTLKKIYKINQYEINPVAPNQQILNWCNSHLQESAVLDYLLVFSAIQPAFAKTPQRPISTNPFHQDKYRKNPKKHLAERKLTVGWTCAK